MAPAINATRSCASGEAAASRISMELAKDGAHLIPLLVMAAGLVTGYVIARRQLGLAEPLLDLRLFRGAGFSVSVGAQTFGLYVLAAIPGLGLMAMAGRLQVVVGLAIVSVGIQVVLALTYDLVAGRAPGSGSGSTGSTRFSTRRKVAADGGRRRPNSNPVNIARSRSATVSAITANVDAPQHTAKPPSRARPRD